MYYVLFCQTASVHSYFICSYTSFLMSHSCASELLFVVDSKLYFPMLVMTPPPESNSVGPIAGAAAAVGSVAIISFTIIITAIIVTRNR